MEQFTPVKTVAINVISDDKVRIKKEKHLVVTSSDIENTMQRYGYNQEVRNIISSENLLPAGLLSRLHAIYPKYSDFLASKPFLFQGKERYSGLSGFREVCAILSKNGIEIGNIAEREFFVEVYRFLATRHSLNSINWNDYINDSIFHLVFAQPGMIDPELTKKYVDAADAKARTQIAVDYMERTNPHDGNQQLNKPWFENDEGEM